MLSGTLSEHEEASAFSATEFSKRCFHALVANCFVSAVLFALAAPAYVLAAALRRAGFSRVAAAVAAAPGRVAALAAGARSLLPACGTLQHLLSHQGTGSRNFEQKT